MFLLMQVILLEIYIFAGTMILRATNVAARLLAPHQHLSGGKIDRPQQRGRTVDPAPAHIPGADG